MKPLSCDQDPPDPVKGQGLPKYLKQELSLLMGC